MMLPRRLLLPIVLLAAGALLVACDPGPNPSIVLGRGSGSPAIGISGDSMHRLAANAGKWSSGKKFKRRCDGGFGCWLGTKKVDVEIFADTGAMNDGPSTSSAPILVGKLVNHGNARTEMYGLDNGGYDYLLWVVPGGTSADTGRFAIVRVDTLPPHDTVTVTTGIQIGCGHRKTWTSSFAEFLSCADGPPPQRVVSGDPPKGSSQIKRAGFFSFAGLLGLAFGHEDPAWFTCTSGCCTAGEPQ